MVVITKPVRPLNVTIAAALVAIDGLWRIVVSLWEAIALTTVEYEAAVRLLEGSSALFGIAYVVSAVGLWRLRGWAWWFTIITNGLSFVVLVFGLARWSRDLDVWLFVGLMSIVAEVSLLAANGPRQAFGAEKRRLPGGLRRALLYMVLWILVFALVTLAIGITAAVLY